MIEKRLNLSLELLRTVAAISHILPWSEYWIYTLLLSQRDPNTLRVRVDQKEIAEATGYGERSIKYGVANLTALDLIRKWRGPMGSNYYDFVLPLSDTVVKKIREHIPAFGREMESAAKRKRGSKKAPYNTVVTPEDMQEAPLPQDVFQGTSSEDQSSSFKEERPLSEQETTQEVTSELHTTPESTGPTLDPGISALLDNLEKRTVRNTTVYFLESVGVVGPQIAMDEPITVNREGLLAYVLEHNKNSIDSFGELIQGFDVQRHRLPHIDVPSNFPIPMQIHRKLDLFPCGEQWLWTVVKRKNGDGFMLSDREIRQNLYNFMRESGIPTFDAVIALAKEKHCEAVGKKPTDYVRPEQFGLGGYVN